MSTAPLPTDFRLWTPDEKRASMNDALRTWRVGEDVWVFGYGSLIWRPEFDFVERRLALLRGHHRALCLWSRVNRGTPETPGLVFGRDRGGACRGVVYRLAGAQVPTFFPQLWDREMPTGAYRARWINCATPAGAVRALVFVMDRHNPLMCPPCHATSYWPSCVGPGVAMAPALTTSPKPTRRCIKLAFRTADYRSLRKPCACQQQNTFWIDARQYL